MILMFIKHLPFCQPDTAFALTLFSAFDDMLWNEYNIPRPSPRKQTSGAWSSVLTIEAALADKFFLKESAIAYEDMHPDENGFLRPFDMGQLVDVIRSLQQSMSPEIIINAWSHARLLAVHLGARLPRQDPARADPRQRAGHEDLPCNGARRSAAVQPQPPQPQPPAGETPSCASKI